MRRRIKKDKKWLRQRNWLKDAGTLSVESSLAANLRYPWLSIRSKVCALTQTLPSFWWYAPTCTFVLNHSWFLTRLPSPPPPSFSPFFISPLCAGLCEYFSSEPRSKFWQGPSSIWTDSKRGKCKAPHLLLNNSTTWEASTRHLHFMASCQSLWLAVTPEGYGAAEGSDWQVLVRVFQYKSSDAKFCI